MNPRALVRAGLLVIGVPQLIVGIWAVFAQVSFFNQFPGIGIAWLPEFGPYNDHLAADAGAGLLAAGVLALAAAIVCERRVVQVALAGWLAFAIPHTVFHVLAYDILSGLANVANFALLGLTVIVPIALIPVSRRLP